MSDFTRDTFFKVYDKNRRAEGLAVTIVDDIRAFGQVTDDMLVLTEVPEQNAFKDITEMCIRDRLKDAGGYDFYADDLSGAVDWILAEVTE